MSASPRVELPVAGMTCEGCVRAVTRALERVAGVTHVRVTLAPGRAEVEGAVRAEVLVAAIEDAGFSVPRA